MTPPPKSRPAAPSNDPYRVLEVIDRLEVGPVVVEPQKLTAPYRVVRGKTEERFELVYRYEEPVFDAADPGSRNLAAMIAVQPALNYGLFCSDLVLVGSFDEHDRRFLEEMARNTAREILVNKFLLPNPFLDKSVQSLPAVRSTSHLRSRLIFVAERGVERAAEAGRPTERPRPASWDTSPDRYAILSSGGKDSLLSQGLLDEIGAEVHPIYINESGRHWYTALNAHRYFEQHVPNTARAWTNVDRLYNSMLRVLPFIRRDYARVRADDYPVRLWTVAGLVFGALPLVRKRGIGRLVLGDEFDTTLRLTFKGLSHYGGLYDQSRWFDSALSRYFARKRWGVCQFSILRPLSELLIEKVLVERYPRLQALQVSCHAAHIDGDTVHPCGRCEKCRRIVGMLTALGADPRACGYSEAQIEEALTALKTQGVHQEQAGAQQMYQMLVEAGRLDSREARSTAARPRPEVLQLRFDPERSPFDTIPNDLRAPLYRILLEHAQGAVRRSGKVWVATDPLGPDALSIPYRFGSRKKAAASESRQPAAARPYLLAELSWPEAKVRLREVDIALLPVGAIEQHGPHLPLDVDSYDAEQLCWAVAEACGDPKPIVLPLIPYGVSYHHEDFAGTISIAPSTLSQLVYEVGVSVARQGITKLVIVNGHGGNGPALHFAAQLVNRDAHIFTCVDTGESSDADVDALAETPSDVHAGEIETATTLAKRPHLVNMEVARANVPHFSSDYLEFSSRKGVGWYVRTARISEDGVLGDPTKASVEKGKKVWEIWIRNLVELVEDLKSMTLDDIYQRRY